MKERPILFSAPMVKAILEGRKSQTRRIVKPHKRWPQHHICKPEMMAAPWSVWFHGDETDRVGVAVDCPYGQPGDRLWVRETWALDPDAHPEEAGALYRATDPGWDENESGLRWKPSIFMPRWASRITLEVTGVRVERLQEMPWQDAIAEGIKPVMCCSGIECGCQGMPVDDPTWAFQDLWNSINGAGSWESNPWVWVVEFRRIEAREEREDGVATSPKSAAGRHRTTASPASPA